MPVSPHLRRKLREKLGVEAGDDLVNHVNQADKLDVAIAELRGEMAAMRAGLEALLYKGLRDQTRFFFVAWSVLLAAIVGLYTR